MSIFLSFFAIFAALRENLTRSRNDRKEKLRLERGASRLAATNRFGFVRGHSRAKTPFPSLASATSRSPAPYMNPRSTHGLLQRLAYRLTLM